MELADADIVLVRHGETTYNALGLLNGDPAVDVPLTELGIAQCRALRPVLERIDWAAFVVSPFARTRQSLAEMLPAAEPTVDPDLGDINLGVLESQPREVYRTWRKTHGIDQAPEGGESRLHVIERYARGLRRLAHDTPYPVLVVTHDQPIRYLLNVLQGDDPIVGPARPVRNATPHAFRAATLADGAERLAAVLR